MKTEIHSDFYMVYCCKKNKWSLPTMPKIETRVTAMPSIQKLKALHCFRYKFISQVLKLQKNTQELDFLTSMMWQLKTIIRGDCNAFNPEAESPALFQI